jgi:uncharacterized LabA/DUF88 family protein
MLGFFLSVCPSVDHKSARVVANAISRLVTGHLKDQKIYGEATERALLYRVFYYDARPYMGKAQQPVSKLPIDYAKTDQAHFRTELFDELRQRADTAVRLGDVRRERNWILNERPQNKLLSGDLGIDNLKDEDFRPGLKQKAVDMRIGLDIASIALKKTSKHHNLGVW